MRRSRIDMVFHAVACAFLIAGLARAQARPVELLVNGGFETAEKNAPKGWQVNNAGKLSLSDQARTGKQAAKFEAIEHEWKYCAFTGTVEGFTPKAKYHLSFWARGTGTLQAAVYQYSRANFVGIKFLSPTMKLTLQWQKLELTYTTADKRVRRVSLALNLRGRDAVAYIDDASFTFDPKANAGEAEEQGPPRGTNRHSLRQRPHPREPRRNRSHHTATRLPGHPHRSWRVIRLAPFRTVRKSNSTHTSRTMPGRSKSHLPSAHSRPIQPHSMIAFSSFSCALLLPRECSCRIL